MEKIEDVAVSRPAGSRPSRVEFLRAQFDEDRRKHPYRYVDVNSGPCPLFVENVAQMLGCHVDFVRRIPRKQLPASRVGRRVIYLREDVLRYIASKMRVSGPCGHPQATNFAVLAPDHSGRDPQPFDPIRLVNQTKEKDRANGKKGR